MTSQESERTSKGERTKARIVDAALELFREHGYEATTMRMVADRAGVSLGNTYYYFDSKELLLEAFYREVHEDHLAAAEPMLEAASGLQSRLLAVMNTKLDVIEPYHRFAALMFRTAADPKSPLNPFHPSNEATRTAEEDLFRKALDGHRVKIPKDLEKELPRLLWTYGMGVLLYWIHDDSPDRERTRRLIEHTVDLVVQSVRLASNPLMRSVRKRVMALLGDLAVGGS